MDHLMAMKSYLLLGRGDFADALIEALGCEKDVLKIPTIPTDGYASTGTISLGKPTFCTDIISLAPSKQQNAPRVHRMIQRT